MPQGSISNLADAADSSRFGSKTARLALLLREGFRVPDGVAIDVDGCRRLLAGDPAVADQILAAVRRLPGPFAVRSSGVNEDSGSASFAGQFETILHVQAADLPDAVRRCAESGRSGRVTAYAASRGLEAGGAAVLVQQMISPDWAGVLFTGNPVTQNPHEMVVNAAEGTGDAVAAGTVTPRTVRIDRDGRPLGPDSLDAAMLAELFRAGRAVARLLGEPADIEWAWTAGELHLLQARPITNIVRYPPRARDYSNIYVWTHVNFAETMPSPVSPLGWSLMEHAAERVFKGSLRLQNRAGCRLFEFLFGRVYWNLTIAFGSPLLVRLLSDSLGSLSPPVQAEVERLAREHRIRPRPVFTLAQKLVILVQLAFAVPWILLRVAWAFVRRPRFDELEERIRRRTRAGASSPRELARAMSGVVEGAVDDMRLDYGPCFLLSVFFFQLYMAAAPRLLRIGAADALELLTGAPDRTTEAGLSLWELAQIRRREPERFEEAFARHLERYGHRGPGEQDIYHPRFADAPELARALVDNCSRSERPPSGRREERERRVRDRLASLPWPRRVVVAPLRRLTSTWLPHRENGKHFLMLAFQQVRRLALRLGDRLVAEGRLRDPKDLFFFTLAEISDFGRGRELPFDRLAPRRSDFHRYANVRAPILLSSDGWAMAPAPPAARGDLLRGDAASAGVATGRVRVILDPHAGARFEPGDVLVAPHTDPGWTPLFLTAAAVVTEVGGIISHGAVVARELGLPAVVNVEGATTRLKEGEIVTVDGSRGEVRVNAESRR